MFNQHAILYNDLLKPIQDGDSGRCIVEFSAKGFGAKQSQGPLLLMPTGMACDLDAPIREDSESAGVGWPACSYRDDLYDRAVTLF